MFVRQPRGSSGEHSAAVGAKWDISNKQRLGYSEVELVQKMIDGVTKVRLAFLLSLRDIEQSCCEGFAKVRLSFLCRFAKVISSMCEGVAQVRLSYLFDLRIAAAEMSNIFVGDQNKRFSLQMVEKGPDEDPFKLLPSKNKTRSSIAKIDELCLSVLLISIHSSADHRNRGEDRRWHDS